MQVSLKRLHDEELFLAGLPSKINRRTREVWRALSALAGPGHLPQLWWAHGTPRSKVGPMPSRELSQTHGAGARGPGDQLLPLASPLMPV